MSASDPDDEVRAVVRLVFDALRAGVPLERMAVLYGAPEPYARLVHEQLDAAGIVHNGAAVRTLADSVLGRGLLGLLALPDRDYQRHDVMRLLASAPVFHRGRAAPAARWERISRTAEIVRGPEQWHQRLDRYAPTQEFELAAERAVTERDPHPEHFEAELAATRALQDFVATLVDELAVDPAASWRDLAGWAERLVHDHLAPEPRRTDWPEVERRAAEKVEAALARLAGLDAVEAHPGLAVFRRTLELELDADLGRVGRFGDGLLMGHVSLGLGLDLDRVFVCGLAEGLFPARVRDDSLLPDAERRATQGELPLRAARVDDDHRRLLAALAGASEERVLLFPRGDLRRTTERVPSRFLVEQVEHAAPAGTERLPDDLAGLEAGCYTPVPSFAAGLARLEFPATEQEHRLRALLDHTARVSPSPSTTLRDVDVALRRGFDTVTARSSREFTRFDGNLEGYDAGRVTDGDVVVSPTRLQTYAYNPFDYLLEYVLAGRHRRAARGALRGVAARPRQPGARGPRRVPGRGAHPARRRTGARDAVDRRRPRPVARHRRRALRGVRGTGTHGAAPVLAPRPPTHPRRARPVPHRGLRDARASSACARSPPSCASVSATPRPRSTSTFPTAARCGSVAPPTASTAPPTMHSGSSTTRPVDRTASIPSTPPPRAGCCSSRCTRTRRGRRSAARTRRWERPTGT